MSVINPMATLQNLNVEAKQITRLTIRCNISSKIDALLSI